jgi:hypothetical protein
MNLLLGLVIGVLLTIGTAFIADAFTAGEVTSETCSNRQLGRRKRAFARLYCLNSDWVGSSQKWLAEPRVVLPRLPGHFFPCFLPSNSEASPPLHSGSFLSAASA